MSQRRNRDFDPFGPSTSGGHRKKPYSRSESESSVKSITKSVIHESDASTSTHSQQPTEPVQIKKEGGDVGPVQETRGRRKMESIYVTRPPDLKTKSGTSGRPIMLQSNHFKVPTVPNWSLYKYRVDFEPEESRTFIRKGLLKLHKERVGAYIFDGTVLYTSCRIPDKVELVSTRKSDETPVKIIIRLVGDMKRDDPHYIQFFNIIMRKCLEYLKLQLVGRDYYDARNKVSIPQFRLELWPGYVTSIRQYENSILMCAEITHKVMRQETLLDILRDGYRRGHDYKKEFCNNVIGIMVLTDYNNHTYRIEDVDFDTSPSSTFMKSGQSITYQSYYKDKYKITITDATQPMLVTRSKPKARNAGQGDLVYLVPELCRATGLTDNMRENVYLMRELATHTRVTAAARVEKLLRFNNTLRQVEKVTEELNSWNLRLENNLLDVPARILPGEKLVFGRNSRIPCFNGDWTRPMQQAHMYQPRELRNWVLIINQRDQRSLQPFLSNLSTVSCGISFNIMPPRVHQIYDDKSSRYAETLEDILSKNSPDLILCVVSNNRSDRYAAIKKKCCVDRPVPSQVILQKNLCGKNALTIATKVAIQMNCKLGGAPWHIENSIKGLMTIGFDICHDSNTKGRNFLAMVATVDQTLTRYFSTITLYHSSEELIEQLCAHVSKAVQAYRMHNKALPMHLVIYRDGVSDGQIPYVYENEVPSLKKKLEELYYGPNFKLVFVIVSKRINIRLFNNRNNPSIGTIVDDVITSPFKYDFFLVSQNIRQGTVSPTSYNIIFDNSGLGPDKIQTLTYKLTHMYYNCSSTVRVPAPCHYAQKLSFLVGRVLHRPPSTQLENKLFFL
ncbi:piwi-like protein Siwi [Nylanderia fulva]|uniref:piwi-like protein Siwi n=1 Tax=Nylanderia fulva TaxID=613905 RepID=UPI0010FB0E6B|nr:piwi-like protein Siwi [Nylanderia fulva]XP_029174291.1 piwi-like protein Siwi [Nylanderia fulva]